MNAEFLSLALIGVLIVIAVILLFAIFMNKKNKLINDRLQSQLAYQTRLHQTELKALRGQMNPHFVHNSINAILYYIQRNEVAISEDYLSKFSKLIRLFFEYSRRQYVSIEEEIELLNNYLQLEKLRFEDKIEFNIKVDPKIDIEEVRLPAMMLQPIVENSINHGLFHKEEKGMVSIQFVYKNDTTYEVIIEDDGIGFIEAKELKMNQSDTVNAHSSNVLEERVALLNLSKQWKVSLNMNDKSELGQGRGAIVHIVLQEIIED